ncbi:MAG TPA: ABC transporter transmembrane domain-containing protein, partial [Roseimicrobium sp.]|nr:ABC transporter transmembrane domain-containing protein [Roseimicrobium sp.]
MAVTLMSVRCMNELRRALRFFKPDRSRMAVIVGLLGLCIVANLIKPWPLALLVDSVLGTKPGPEWLQKVGNGANGKLTLVLFLSLAVLGTHILHGALSAARDYLAIGVGLRGLQRVRNEVFSSLQRLSLRFHQGSRSGDLLYRAAWDTFSVQTLFQQGMMTTLGAA